MMDSVILDFAKHLGMKVSLDQSFPEMVAAEQKKYNISRVEAENRVHLKMGDLTESHLTKVLGARTRR